MTTAAPTRPGRTSGAAGARPDLDPAGPRTFPCEQCGADLEFAVGQRQLRCPHCGQTRDIPSRPPGDPPERVYDQDAIARARASLRGQAATGPVADATAPNTQQDCGACGAKVVFDGPLTSSRCAFCGTPLQRDAVHTAATRLQVDGVLPFEVARETARAALARWVRGRWFAPSAWRRDGVRGDLAGAYLPFFTFDAMTFTRYRGERGHTTGTGKHRRTKWTSVAGEFERFFDDVLACGAQHVDAKVLERLEPWPLERLEPFRAEFLAGFEARTYDVELNVAFADAKVRIEAAIERDVRERIGGGEQRIHDIASHYEGLTYKHVLLPVWLLAYRDDRRGAPGRVFQVTVNAITGQVSGQRPWSAVKIALAVAAALIAIAILASLK